MRIIIQVLKTCLQFFIMLFQVEQYSIQLFGRLSSGHLAQHDRPRDLGAAAGEEGVDSRRLREPSTSVQNLDGAAGGADLLLHQRGVSNPWTEGRADLRGAPQEEQPERPEGFKDRGPRSSSPLCDHQVGAAYFLSNAFPPLSYLGAFSASAGSLTLFLGEFRAPRTDRRGSFKNSKLSATPRLTTRSVLVPLRSVEILSPSISR